MLNHNNDDAVIINDISKVIISSGFIKYSTFFVTNGSFQYNRCIYSYYDRSRLSAWLQLVRIPPICDKFTACGGGTLCYATS